MTELSERAQKFKRTLKNFILAYGDSVTYSDLEGKAKEFASVVPDPPNEHEIEAVVADITIELTIKFSQSGSVVDPETFEPWLAERKTKSETPRWNAYEQLLLERDWDTTVISEIDFQSEEVLELVGDPEKPGEWARRGLLIGEVQSGKTANYLALLNKGLDFGYKVVIVIGGHTNELRRQTQSRLDTDLLGIDSEFLEDNIANVARPDVGVRTIDPDLQAHFMTTVNGDFSAKKKIAGITWMNDSTPTVFVIKKNARVIANVASYIRHQSTAEKMSMPLLVVDDESDWGTPNTGSETDPTRVNKEIRRLLESSSRSSYLGITATPFANVFIDHEAKSDEAGLDLFPKDYIRALSSPSTYSGVSSFFLDEHKGLRLDVEDCLEAIPIVHKNSHQVFVLPDSLRAATISFFLGTAIRRRRDGRKQAAAMLVNVSRFNNVQSQVHTLLEEFVKQLRDMVLGEFGRASIKHSSLYEEVEQIWKQEFADVQEGPFSNIKETLMTAISEFRVELVNSATAADRRRLRKSLTSAQRDDRDLEPTIFVGGDVLSRGLTLAGLQVSYFVREPRTMDTLMQMGRWFGYQKNYADLVRLWIPEGTAQDFSDSAEVTAEFKQMLIEMKSRNLTPKQFGLRVRTHPEGLKIVAANKSRATEVLHEGPMLFENRIAGSRRLNRNLEARSVNYDATLQLLASMTASSGVVASKSSGGYHLWSGVPMDTVRQYLLQFRGHKSCETFGVQIDAQPSTITGAIGDAKNSDFWDVCFVGGSGDSHQFPNYIRVKTSERNRLVLEDDLVRMVSPVTASFSLSNSLSDDEKTAISSAFPEWEAEEGYSNEMVLSTLNRPRLLVFPCSVPSHKTVPELKLEMNSENPLIALAVVFPKLDPEEAVRVAERAKTYRVNTVWLQNYYSPQFDLDELYDEELDD